MNGSAIPVAPQEEKSAEKLINRIAKHIISMGYFGLKQSENPVLAETDIAVTGFFC